MSLPLSKFYTILNTKNKILLGIAFFASFTAGLLMPSIAVVMGSVVGSFDPRNGTSIDEIMGELLKKILAVAFVLWFLGYVQYAFMQ
jgi:ABC-type dipeptide/oligopeptide/nickel transport system permease subunit